MSERRFIRRSDNGGLLWTWPVTLPVAGFGLLSISTGVVLHYALPANDGDVGFSVVGAIALLVAVAGRVSSERWLRYKDKPLPSPTKPTRARTDHDESDDASDDDADPVITVDDRPGPRRVRVRRRSGMPYVLMAVSVAALVGDVLDDWHRDPALHVAWCVLTASALAVCYLLGPVSRFVVTPDYLRIDTAFRTTLVPRNRIRAFESHGTDVWLILTRGDNLWFRVDSPVWESGRASRYRTNNRTQWRTVAQIVAALDAVPAGQPSHRIVTAPRRGMIALAVGTAVVSLTALFVLLPMISS